MDTSERNLIEIILSKRKDLTRERLEEMINEKVMELNISRKTAIYLIMIELGVSLESPIKERVKINELTEGLSNINVLGRIVWLKPTEFFEKVILTRGGIMDETGIQPIIFWRRRKEDLVSEGINEGVVIEVKGAYTKKSLSGGIEIHVPQRARIEVIREMREIPHPYNHLLTLDKDIANLGRVNTYGKVLTNLRKRIVKVGEEEISVGSFLIGYKDVFKRIVIWRKNIDEYMWVKPGMKIVIYLGKVKLNKFGETEIHVGRNSHIVEDPTLDIELSINKGNIADIKPGLNLIKITAKILAKGIVRKKPDTEKYTQSILIADETREATLVLLEDKISEAEKLNIGDVIEIGLFRASLRGDNIYLFATENTWIKKREDIDIKPALNIESKNISLLTLEDKIVNISGRLIRGPMVSEDFIDTKYCLIEDEDGKPFKVVFRGEIDNYSRETIREGDKIYIQAGIVDLYPLLVGSQIPIIRLRAYSRILKI